MSYQLTVAGHFHLVPPLDRAGRAVVDAANRGWRVSKDGTQLYLPEDEHPDAFEGLKLLITEVLPQIGSVPQGEVAWAGEDGAEGTIRVNGRDMQVEQSDPEELGPDEVSRLLGDLVDGGESQQLEALDILESFHVRSEEVVGAMAASLRSESLQVRMRAANALGSFGAASLSALPELIAALRDAEPWMQAAAAEAIGAIGPDAASALPALTELEKHPSYGPAGRATEAISRIRGGS